MITTPMIKPLMTKHNDR